MADIKRYGILAGSFSMYRHKNGPYVLHADHEAAIKELMVRNIRLAMERNEAQAETQVLRTEAEREECAEREACAAIAEYRGTLETARRILASGDKP